MRRKDSSRKWLCSSQWYWWQQKKLSVECCVFDLYHMHCRLKNIYTRRPFCGLFCFLSLSFFLSHLLFWEASDFYVSYIVCTESALLIAGSGERWVMPAPDAESQHRTRKLQETVGKKNHPPRPFSAGHPQQGHQNLDLSLFFLTYVTFREEKETHICLLHTKNSKEDFPFKKGW